MDLALIAAAGLMGLLGAPHCAAMCGAPCAALAQRCGGAQPSALAALLGGRLLSYMAGGAAVAASVALFSAAGALAPALRPLWAAAHMATLALGAWMLFAGRLPDAFGGIGRASPVSVSVPLAAGWQPVAGPLRSTAAGALKAAAAGTLWVAMPCGLLQSALVVAALANTPWHGAAAMGAFAMSSSLGLAVLPALAARLPQRLSGERAMRGVVRLSGALLLVASGWALGHGLWERVAAFCAAL